MWVGSLYWGRLYIQYLDKWVAHNSIARANRRFQTLFPFTKVTFWSVHLSHSQIAMKPVRQCSTSPHRPPKAHLQPRRRPPEPCSWPWPWLLSACPCAPRVYARERSQGRRRAQFQQRLSEEVAEKNRGIPLQRGRDVVSMKKTLAIERNKELFACSVQEVQQLWKTKAFLLILYVSEGQIHIYIYMYVLSPYHPVLIQPPRVLRSSLRFCFCQV